jgi:hypothetical protein
MNLIIRGTIHWDQQEYRRRAQGHKCISFGPIPESQARGEPGYQEVPDSWRTSWTPTKMTNNAEKAGIQQKIRYFETLEKLL